MVTEIAFLYIRLSKSAAFEEAFALAAPIISSMSGYIEHELQKCLEEENKYVLIVRWETLEDHTIGFRQHEKYQKWKNLLHPFYEPFPIVEHYTTILK